MKIYGKQIDLFLGVFWWFQSGFGGCQSTG